MTAPLPPAFEDAHRVLVLKGPLTVDELLQHLHERGFRLSPDLAANAPQRYPEFFAATDDGRLTTAQSPSGSEETEPSDDDVEHPAAGRSLSANAVPRVPPSKVVVFDLETTGLDRATDEVWEIAAVRLDGSEEFRLRLEVSTGLREKLPLGLSVEPEIPLAHALTRLNALLGEGGVLAGHNIRAFDVPFLEAAAKRLGLEWRAPAVLIDLVELSTLVWPTLPNRTLGDLCTHCGVDPGSAHRALDDTRATSGVLNAAIDAIDMTDPSWTLAIACLDQGGHGLASVLPPTGASALTADLVSAGLSPVDDPLVALPSDSTKSPALDTVVRSLRTLTSGPGFTERPAQRVMATSVARALDGATNLAVEAPTGTGKSLAYLLPAIGAATDRAHPVIVATATKALQVQLREDAENLQRRGLLGVPFRQVMGVENYICTRNLAEMILEPEDTKPDWLASAVGARALASAPGGVWDDIGDGALLAADVRYRTSRRHLRTTAAECDRKNCDWADSCPMLMRREAVDRWPGVVVANHAVVATWVRNGWLEEGVGSPRGLLRERATSLIFDEAHQLEDSLTSAWTEKCDNVDLDMVLGRLRGRRGPLRLVRRLLSRLSDDDGAKVRQLLSDADRDARALSTAAEQLSSAIGIYVHEYGGRDRATTLMAGAVSARPELQPVRARMIELRRAAQSIATSLTEIRRTIKPLSSAETGRVPQRMFGVETRLAEIMSIVQSFIDLSDPHIWVYRMGAEFNEDRTVASWTLERIPIEIGPFFSDDIVKRARSVVLTSATLTVESEFTFLEQRLGIRVTDDPSVEGRFEGAQLPSPFAFEEQAIVVLTNHLPVPVPANERQFVEDVAADQVGLLSLTGGRALTLFAARQRMLEVATRVRQREAELGERGVKLLVQNEQSRSETARRFLGDPGTVLYGLRTYWEGFNAPGDTLQYLIIEKPPYPHPGDPLVQARQRALADRGLDPFIDYALPKTAMLFAQGFGRLIRSESDRGAAIVLDRRLHSPGMARRSILGSLPTTTVHEAFDRDDAWTTAIRFVTGEEPDLANALSLPLDDVTALLAELRLVVGEDPEPKLRRAAHALFGIERLHEAQLAIMKALLAGHDAMGVLPTGFGKSLCFQLPALLHPHDRATVVVSPLVALIKDQVDELRAQRGFRAVQGITGNTSRVVQTEILRDVASGKVRLLYVSPERFVRDRTLRASLAREQINALVVDEAHCISVWGHDFRPEFRQLADAVRELPRSPRIALTATATPRVQADIIASLEMGDPIVVREGADRPNLRFRVFECKDDGERARQVLRIATAKRGSPGIIYASRRATTEELAGLLRRAGFAARHYHAGMVPEQREAVQEDFHADVTQIIVATKAFGMGINKPDIGWVLHYDLPDSLDGYAQEAGRAARRADLVGDCVLLFTRRDEARRRRQVRVKDARSDLAKAHRVLAWLGLQERRGADVHFDPEVAADELSIELDDLNVILARLELAKCVRRRMDATARGMVAVGHREPIDEHERERFRRVFNVLIHARPHVRNQVDLAKLAERGEDVAQLEDDLVSWTLDRLVTFHSTQRLWRVELVNDSLDGPEFLRIVEEWERWSIERLEAVIRYARVSTCRRILISSHFGDPTVTCGTSDHQPCDVCSGADPFWAGVAAKDVADPETLIDARLAVLQAVSWSSVWQKGRYGERGLLAAVRGAETLGEGRPLGAGLLSCPQFGALRYVRGAERRCQEAAASLIADGLIERDVVSAPGRAEYTSLRLTPAGDSYLRKGRG